MGGNCSSETDDNSLQGEQDAPDLARNTTKLNQDSSNPPRLHPPMAGDRDNSRSMGGGQYNLVSALDDAVKARSQMREQRCDIVLDNNLNSRIFQDASDYGREREEVVTRERVLAFDYLCQVKASQLEIQANQVLQAVRKHDQAKVYEKAPTRRGYGGQEHPRFMGDHFLSNVDLIEQTKLYRVAQEMPKGAHLHIHFNANLLPEVLINIAKEMDRMFITSDMPLVPVGDDGNSPGYYGRFDQCRIQFSILSPEREKPGNLFDPNYTERGTMRFQDFLREFDAHYNQKSTKCSVDEWLRNKLVFHEEESHNLLQTPEG